MGCPCFFKLAGGQFSLVAVCPTVSLPWEAFVGSLEGTPPPELGVRGPSQAHHTPLASGPSQMRPNPHPLASGTPHLVGSLLGRWGNWKKRRFQQEGPSPATFKGAHTTDMNPMYSSLARRLTMDCLMTPPSDSPPRSLPCLQTIAACKPSDLMTFKGGVIASPNFTEEEFGTPPTFTSYSLGLFFSQL